MKPSHTRLRIGSGGLVYLLVSALILGAAIYTQANLLFWGFGLMVGGVVVSIGCAAVSLRGLELARIVPTHAAAGEPLTLHYRIENYGWLPAFGVVIRENWGRGMAGWKHRGPASGHEPMLGGPPHAWVLHLRSGRQLQVAAPCIPLHRGELAWERVEASTAFPFGVFFKTVVFDAPDQLTVFPRLFRMQRQMLSRLSAADGSAQQTISRAGAGDEFFGIREYRPGDSLRTIDWKHTARTGDLVARELTQPSPPQLRLLLDLRHTPPTVVGARRKSIDAPDRGLTQDLCGRQLEERAISLAASLVCEAHLHGYRIGLRVAGPEAIALRPRHSLPHRTQLLETLAMLKLNQRDAVIGYDSDAGPVDVVIWAGRGNALPQGTNNFGRTAMVLGAADFDRYVADATPIESIFHARAFGAKAGRRMSLSQLGPLIATPAEEVG